ncbi:MAG: hydantoinase/oxoprolinase family protein, partial [Firmicutes bacterium]|nr:hydantoinase/oxoprolinase family protein [Bacillota bacterium]
MRIGIGIDTGGTCTDAVAMDLDSRKVLAKGKTETTREDLSIGIAKALDMLPIELVQQAEQVALSTTLATNACIEGKGCRAKLVIFGIHDEYLRRIHAPENYNLKPEYVLCVDTNSSADGLMIDEPDWDELFKEHGKWLTDSDALCAVELWSDDIGAPCEKKFKVLAEEKTGRRCITANELTEGINIFARGATALLNARLLPVVSEFLAAAEKAFRERGCKADIRIVRSDGCIMSDEYSLIRPVDTVLSGPAASVLAGKAMTDSENYIIVDMGGTSTDISVVSSGKPVRDENGIRIGG